MRTRPGTTRTPRCSSTAAADIALAVKTGKIDAALYDEVPLLNMLRDDPALGILGDSLFSFSVGAGFSKNDPALRRNFDRFLAEIKRNGIHAGMVDRWIRKGESRMPELPTRGPAAYLRLGEHRRSAFRVSPQQ